MEPRIVNKPAFKVAGYELQTTTRDDRSYQEVPAFWCSMTAERLAALHRLSESVSKAELGMCFPTDPATGDFSYVIAVEVGDFTSVPAGMFMAEIPQAVYAVFTTPANDGEEHIAPAIQSTWRYIHEVWFPSSGYEFADGRADFEFYPCTDQSEKVQIYIPVVRK